MTQYNLTEEEGLAVVQKSIELIAHGKCVFAFNHVLEGIVWRNGQLYGFIRDMYAIAKCEGGTDISFRFDGCPQPGLGLFAGVNVTDCTIWYTDLKGQFSILHKPSYVPSESHDLA